MHGFSAFLFAAFGCTLAIAEPQWNASYAEKTEALSLKGDVTRGEAAFVICQGCHRVGALGRADGSYPRLAGQHTSVLIKQLTDVRSGRRSNAKMLPFADHSALSVQDIADIAAFLQQLPVPADQGQGSGGDLALGFKLYAKDCVTCHGERGEGKADQFYPRLSGQHYRYLLRENQLIRDGGRRNANPKMADAIRHYSDEDLAAVADYISRLPLAPAR
ncbi:MAG: c-type cytochrome [Rhodocyclaceae bacterium]|nr:c-type cytochrome [Rhodocyclaceae bacterium]MDZ4214652.1 c-type cytochrome [Rhodocyclaceae bacterium]